MYLQQYKQAKKAILSLLVMNHDSFTADETLLSTLSQSEQLKGIQLREFRAMAIHALSSF